MEPLMLLVTVGLPRSGKTTWAQSTGHPIVCPDAIRLALHGQRFVPEAEPHVWAIAQTMMMALFFAGHKTVVIDATNTTKERRKMWVSRNWMTKFRVFDADKDECIRRAIDTNRQDIVHVIERMASHFEPMEPEESQHQWGLTPCPAPDQRGEKEPMTHLSQAIEHARQEWHKEHGKCSICDVGDMPAKGLHGSHRCGNATSCIICHGCLPVGEQCQACFRIRMEECLP